MIYPFMPSLETGDIWTPLTQSSILLVVVPASHS